MISSSWIHELEMGSAQRERLVARDERGEDEERERERGRRLIVFIEVSL